MHGVVGASKPMTNLIFVPSGGDFVGPSTNGVWAGGRGGDFAVNAQAGRYAAAILGYLHV